MEEGKETVNARAHVFVSGQVQGVFYRVWCKKVADKLSLRGWVRNINDGRVEVVFEGPKEKVQKMVKKCKKGSRFSKVDDIDIIWEKATGEFDTFEII